MDPGPLEPITIAGKYDRVEAPTFNVGGWFDIFLADTIANFQAMHCLGRPTKLLIGPWTHVSRGNPVGDLNFGFGSQLSFINLQADFGRLQLRWFDHWLKAIDTGMLAEAPIRLFVMGANIWRDEQAWPLERARDTPFYLRANGELSTILEPSHHTNGLMLNAAGNIIACEMDGRLIEVNPKTKEVKSLADGYEGNRFNAPNDLVIDRDGGVYGVPALLKDTNTHVGISRLLRHDHAMVCLSGFVGHRGCGNGGNE